MKFLHTSSVSLELSQNHISGRVADWTHDRSGSHLYHAVLRNWSDCFQVASDLLQAVWNILVKEDGQVCSFRLCLTSFDPASHISGKTNVFSFFAIWFISLPFIRIERVCVNWALVTYFCPFTIWPMSYHIMLTAYVTHYISVFDVTSAAFPRFFCLLNSSLTHSVVNW